MRGNKFALNHNIFMGSSQIPASYEFGANFGDERVASSLFVLNTNGSRLRLDSGRELDYELAAAQTPPYFSAIRRFPSITSGSTMIGFHVFWFASWLGS